MFVPPPVIMVLSMIAINYGSQYLPQFSFAFAEQQLIAVAIALVGLAILLVAVQGFRKADTTINPHKLDTMSHLVTGGLYHYTRNPMYLGMALLIASSGFYFASLFVLPVLGIFVIVINKFQIDPEERALEKRFGQEFLDFKRRTRKWI